jgi:chromosome segregation ATPase
MDARKKTIRELELKKEETLGTINGILANLGETLLVRDDGAGDSEDYRAEYRRILKEIGDSEEHIKTIEADLHRLKEADEEIRLKEQEYSKRHKELSALYTGLGELIMDDPEYAAATESFKPQMDALVPKIKSLEDRLNEIAGGSQSNVFTWIGKNTQGMVFRSLLGKSRGSLQRIYMAVGEQFVVSQDRTGLHDQDIQEFLSKIDEVRRVLASLTENLDALKAERRKIDDFFITEGNPARKTNSLERHIAHAREQLKLLYQNYGARAGEGTLLVPLTEDDTQALEKIKNLRENNNEYDKSIEKLKASLAIDALREEIERMEKGIISHRQRIAATEEGIADLEKRIDEANRHIQELMKI